MALAFFALQSKNFFFNEQLATSLIIECVIYLIRKRNMQKLMSFNKHNLKLEQQQINIIFK